jgi:hypothetical protein
VLIESEVTRKIMARRLLRTVQKRHTLAGDLHRRPAAWAQIAEHARGKLLAV